MASYDFSRFAPPPVSKRTQNKFTPSPGKDSSPSTREPYDPHTSGKGLTETAIAIATLLDKKVGGENTQDILLVQGDLLWACQIKAYSACLGPEPMSVIPFLEGMDSSVELVDVTNNKAYRTAIGTLVNTRLGGVIAQWTEAQKKAFIEAHIGVILSTIATEGRGAANNNQGHQRRQKMMEQQFPHTFGTTRVSGRVVLRTLGDLQVIVSLRQHHKAKMRGLGFQLGYSEAGEYQSHYGYYTVLGLMRNYIEDQSKASYKIIRDYLAGTHDPFVYHQVYRSDMTALNEFMDASEGDKSVKYGVVYFANPMEFPADKVKCLLSYVLGVMDHRGDLEMVEKFSGKISEYHRAVGKLRDTHYPNAGDREAETPEERRKMTIVVSQGMTRIREEISEGVASVRASRGTV
eukprot:TRINITY_DN97121_c0_g1_i1.p1 TRINITY_DN97121_c0_g1~~TRINITY_DN97121_c0_g1_i1.p1  ORF type:complete len:418 (+),score=69.28 TRINITY_DN97121_c0_g1_i1:41-1255(+)